MTHYQLQEALRIKAEKKALKSTRLANKLLADSRAKERAAVEGKRKADWLEFRQQQVMIDKDLELAILRAQIGNQKVDFFLQDKKMLEEVILSQQKDIEYYKGQASKAAREAEEAASTLEATVEELNRTVDYLKEIDPESVSVLNHRLKHNL